jgi:hypothetical protein
VTVEDIRDAVAFVKQSYMYEDDLRWLLRSIDRVVDLIDAGVPVDPDRLLAAFRITSALDPEVPA